MVPFKFHIDLMMDRSDPQTDNGTLQKITQNQPPLLLSHKYALFMQSHNITSRLYTQKGRSFIDLDDRN